MNYWIVKSPFRSRNWEDVVLKGVFTLYGIRNYEARNNIFNMKINDKVFYYHSPSGKKIFGLMEVILESYQDPTTHESKWLAIDFKPIKTFKDPINLSEIKNSFNLTKIDLIIKPRLSVSSIKESDFYEIINLG